MAAAQPKSRGHSLDCTKVLLGAADLRTVCQLYLKEADLLLLIGFESGKASTHVKMLKSKAAVLARVWEGSLSNPTKHVERQAATDLFVGSRGEKDLPVAVSQQLASFEFEPVRALQHLFQLEQVMACGTCVCFFHQQRPGRWVVLDHLSLQVPSAGGAGRLTIFVLTSQSLTKAEEGCLKRIQAVEGD